MRLSKDEKIELGISLYLFRHYVENGNKRHLYNLDGTKNKNHPHWRMVDIANKLGCIDQYEDVNDRFPEVNIEMLKGGN